MPPVLALAPLLLVALLLVLVVLRRRRAAATTAPAAASPVESEEVRLLRLQVRTLTEALQDVDRVAQSVEQPVEQPVEAPVEEPVEVRHEPAVGSTVAAYAELSRSLAAAGRLREAALAQWAGDLRVLAPLLDGRGEQLHAALASLAPVDAAGAVTAARAVAAGLLGPDTDVLASLPDLAHLARRPGTPGERTSYPIADVPADVLPDAVVRALESVLLDAAVRAGDRELVSVGLRCDAVAQVADGRTAAEAAPLVIDVLEPHERTAFAAAYEAGIAS